MSFNFYINRDEEFDYEKSYSIYLKTHPKIDKDVFIDAMKIGYSIGKLNNVSKNKKQFEGIVITGQVY